MGGPEAAKWRFRPSKLKEQLAGAIFENCLGALTVKSGKKVRIFLELLNKINSGSFLGLFLSQRHPEWDRIFFRIHAMIDLGLHVNHLRYQYIQVWNNGFTGFYQKYFLYHEATNG